MFTVLDTIRHWALGVGGSGLFLIALLDSSVLSFPQVADALVLLQSARHPHYLLYYAGMATLGSLHRVLRPVCARDARAGKCSCAAGSRPRTWTADSRCTSRFGMLVVLVPALLPPPAPFKIFVLLSGAAGLSPLAFGLAVAIGRGIRYFAQAWLAAAYGERAGEFLARYGGEAVAVLAAVTLIGVLLYLVRQRRAGRRR